ncbi:MAG: hypothetical protein JRN01_07655 [Nitrososphaerota archaeon]|nr:hypothetical protein [Nitrososphaerota archaeon]
MGVIRNYNLSETVVAGKFGQYEGALSVSSPIEPVYMDVMLEPDSSFTYSTKAGFRAIVYPFEGSGSVNGERMESYRAYVLSESGNDIQVKSGESGARFLLLAGKPLREPVAWYGPIVMNTKDQLEEAFIELDNGTFIKHKEPEFL